MAEIPAVPQVFKDEISSSRAPAAQPPEGRVDAVVGKYQQRAADLPPYISTQPTPEQVEAATQNIIKTTEDARNVWEATHDRIRAEDNRGFFGKVKDNLTGKKPEDRAKAKGELNDMVEKNEARAAAISSLQENLEGAKMYTPEYLARESDPNRIKELTAANQAQILTNKEGTIVAHGQTTVSPEMSQALNYQDRIKMQFAFFKERGIPLHEAMPQKIYDEIQELVGSRDLGRRIGKEEVERAIIAVSAVNEIALRYADANSIKVDQSKYASLFHEGLTITQGVNERFGRSYDFVRRKEGKDTVSTNDVGYYAIGVAHMEELFNRLGIPEGEERVPYILAYTAGAIVNGIPMGLGEICRAWVADSIPVAGEETVRENGEWVKKMTPPKPRGFGSFITRGEAYKYLTIVLKGSSDIGAVGAMEKAGEIVRPLGTRLNEKRNYDLGQEFGEQVKDPVLLKSPN